MASIFPTFLTLAEERMHVTGTMAGWFLVGGGIGGMILPWLIGQAFVQVGPQAMMTLVLMSVILNFLMLLLFTRVSIRPESISERRAIVD